MRTLPLTDDEVSLVTALRTLPSGQRDIVLAMVLEMAAPQIPAAHVGPSGSIIQFPRQ
jgi:hypothetical protein